MLECGGMMSKYEIGRLYRDTVTGSILCIIAAEEELDFGLEFDMLYTYYYIDDPANIQMAWHMRLNGTWILLQ